MICQQSFFLAAGWQAILVLFFLVSLYLAANSLIGFTFNGEAGIHVTIERHKTGSGLFWKVESERVVALLKLQQSDPEKHADSCS